MAITRTAITDDDGSRTTGTILNNAWKTELYNQIDADPVSTAWTPVLQFGGASVGITYSRQSGLYVVKGSLVTAVVNIQLTSKGSSTGAVTISGLPFTANSTLLVPAWQIGRGPVAAVDGIVSLFVAASVSVIQLFSNSIVALTNTDFNNTSQVFGTVTYFK